MDLHIKQEYVVEDLEVELLDKAKYFDNLSKMCIELEAQLETDDGEIKVKHEIDIDDILERNMEEESMFSDLHNIKEEGFLNYVTNSIENNIKSENVFRNSDNSDNTHNIKQEKKFINTSENNDLVEQYIWNYEDPSVPLGWMTTWDKVDNVKRFLSPNGVFWSGRIEAIHYMEQQGTEARQVAEMKEGILDDGWTRDDDLPEGWFVTKGANGDFMYFTDDNVLLESTKSASVFMKNCFSKYGRIDLDKLWKRYALEDGCITKERQEWVIDETYVPKGWKRKFKVFNHGHRRVYFVTPAGSSIAGSIKALRYMSENNYSEEDISIVKQNLLEDGWLSHTFLPEGWYMKREKNSSMSKFKYLSDIFQVIPTNTTAMDILKNDGKSTKEDITNFIALLNQNSSEENKPSFDLMDEDSTVPNGWSVRSCPTNNKKYFVTYKDGRKFVAIRLALEYMIENNFSNDDIKLMASHLIKEGWEEDEKLPNGWYYRRVRSKTSTVTDKIMQLSFLTQHFQLLPSKKVALEHLRKQYDEKTIDRFLEKIDAERKNAFKYKYEYNEKDILPEGWRMKLIHKKDRRNERIFITPDGLRISTLVKALAHMIKTKESEENVDMLLKYLAEDGWTSDELLPKGWHFKSVRHSSVKGGKILKYLTDSFLVIDNNTAALDFMKNNGKVSMLDINNFTLLVNNFLSRDTAKGGSGFEDLEKVPDHWKIRACPTNNNRYSVTYKNANKFAGIRTALQFMAKNNFPKVDIEVMAQHLHKEGWEKDENLPDGWFYRRIKRKESTITDKIITLSFLTQNFQLLPSQKAALKHLKMQFDQNVVNRFLEKIDVERKNAYKNKYEYDKEEDNTLPEGWKMKEVNRRNGKIQRIFITAEGLRIISLTQALQHMLQGNYSKENIATLSNYLIIDGWFTDELLPKGWHFKPGGKSFKYLTETFQIIHSNTAALDYLKSSTLASSVDMKDFMLFVNKDDQKECETKWNENDDQVPDDWKIRPCPTNNKRYSVIFKEANKFPGIRQALQFMKKNNFGKADIEMMAKHLHKEGWGKDEKLPDGWFCRRVKSKESTNTDKLLQLIFLTDDFEVMHSIKGALELLKNSKKYDQKTIDRFIEKIDNERNLIYKTRYESRSEEDILPVGWMMKAVNSKNGHNRRIFVSPDGQRLTSLVNALRHMEKKGDSKENIKLLSTFLIKDGWLSDELLPKGWYFKSVKHSSAKGGQVIKYLTDNFKVIESNTAVLELMKNSDKTSTEDIHNFILLVNKNNSSEKEISWNGFDDEKKVPDNWKVRPCPTNNQRYSVTYKNGTKFSSIRQALEFMVKNNFSKSDINVMAEHLDKEGWEQNEKLPPGWYCRMVKSSKNGNNVLKYLNENFNLIESQTAALESLKSNSNASSTAIDNLAHIINEASGNERRERYDWIENDGTAPKAWKMRKIIRKDGIESIYFLLPDGSSIQGRIKSLRHMTKNQNEYTENDVNMMRDALCQEGWFHLNDLPEKNWMMKQSDTNNKMISPNGQFFVSAKAAIEYVEKSGEYEQGFISKIKNVLEYKKTLKLNSGIKKFSAETKNKELSKKRKAVDEFDEIETNIHNILKRLKQTAS